MKKLFPLLLLMFGLVACSSNVDESNGKEDEVEALVDSLKSTEVDPIPKDDLESEPPSLSKPEPDEDVVDPPSRRTKDDSTTIVDAKPDEDLTVTDTPAPVDTTSSDIPEEEEDLEDIPDDFLPTRSPADRDALIRSFSLKPKIAYLGNMVRFRIESPERKKWKWDYNLDGDKYWDGVRESLNSYVYKELGLKKVKLQAKSKDFNVPFEEDILVTVSQRYLNKLFQELKALAKTADANPSEKNKQALRNKFDAIQDVASDRLMFDIDPDLESGDINFKGFKAVIYAEIGFEEIYKALTEYKYDEMTGRVTFVKLR